MVPFKRLFKRKMGRLPGRLLGTITKEKGPWNYWISTSSGDVSGEALRLGVQLRW